MKKNIDIFIWLLPVLTILGLIFIQMMYRNNLSIWVMYYRVTIILSICCFVILVASTIIKTKNAIREKSKMNYQIFSIVGKIFLVLFCYLIIKIGFIQIPPVSIENINIVYNVHSGNEVDGLVWYMGEKGREDVVIMGESTRYSSDYIDTMITIYSEDNIFSMNGETIEFNGYDTLG